MNEIVYRPAYDQRTVRVSFLSPKRAVKVTAKAREGVDSQLPSERVIQMSIAAYKAISNQQIVTCSQLFVVKS